MNSTKERILQTLAANPRYSINDLAESVGISAISIRHHLSNMEAEMLVASEEERHGVGRPRLVYFLTDKGLERFPTRYFQLTNSLLAQLKRNLTSAEVHLLFQQIALENAQDYLHRSQSLSIEGRLNLVQEALSRQGFVVEWEKKPEGYQINTVNCPYFQVGKNHPEICAIDQVFISSLLNLPAEKINCVLNGDVHCSFMIPNL